MTIEFIIPPHLSRPQGQNSYSFSAPPLDGTLTVPELFEYNALHSPSHPYAVFANGDGTTRTITYAETWRMVKRAARIVQSSCLPSGVEDGPMSTSLGPPIGILANAGTSNSGSCTIARYSFLLWCSDSISYALLVITIMRLGLGEPLFLTSSLLYLDALLLSSSIPHIDKKLPRGHRTSSSQDACCSTLCEPRPGHADGE